MYCFFSVQIPLVGIVENMSHFVCPCCQTKSSLWCTDPKQNVQVETGAAKLAADYNIPLLCQIPIEPHLSMANDKGQPIVLSYPNSVTTSTFLDLAKRVQQFVDK